jgi:hypothetical protein
MRTAKRWLTLLAVMVGLCAITVGLAYIAPAKDFPLTIFVKGEAGMVWRRYVPQSLPKTITLGGSEANASAIKRYNKAYGTAITIRQAKYLNTIIEQDHRAVKRVTRPMLGFKAVAAAQCTVAGVELMHMLKKGQLVVEEGVKPLTPAEQFYGLAA